ncbi:MAG: hypothetical protein A4E49_00969 [Methanosaeta sp. PtaU1.Bin112]|nr:MAG: hypothetical protein A4E49_00969 [Methanosaeta sp. PtaU1.Bin112]
MIGDYRLDQFQNKEYMPLRSDPDWIRKVFMASWLILL